MNYGLNFDTISLSLNLKEKKLLKFLNLYI